MPNLTLTKLLRPTISLTADDFGQTNLKLEFLGYESHNNSSIGLSTTRELDTIHFGREHLGDLVHAHGDGFLFEVKEISQVIEVTLVPILCVCMLLLTHFVDR